MDNQVLISNINYLCEKQRINISQLEKATETAANTIKRWATSVPGVDKVEKVALFFNVSIESLISVPMNNEYIEDKGSIVDSVLAKTINRSMIWSRGGYYAKEDYQNTPFFKQSFELAQKNLNNEITPDQYVIDIFYSAFGNCGFHIVKFTNKESYICYYELLAYVTLGNNPTGQMEFISSENTVKDCYNYIEGELYNTNYQYVFNKFIREFKKARTLTTDTLPVSFDGCYLADDEGNIIFYNEKCLSAYKAKVFYQTYKKSLTIGQSNLGLQKTVPIMRINLTDNGVLVITNANQYTMRINHMEVNDEIALQILKDIVNDVGYEIVFVADNISFVKQNK